MQEEKIFLVPYDPNWPQKFQKEKELLQKKIGEFITGGIHHVGSTAIPGIWAKPVIDILIGVKSLQASKPCIKILQTIGYVYYPYKPQFEHWFCKPSAAHRKFHLHLMPADSAEFKAKIAFRDYLLVHPVAAREYQNLKTSLAQQFKDDREAYTDAKAEFVKIIVKKALGENFEFEI